MKKLTYGSQLQICFFSAFLGGMASWLLGIPVLRNLGWILGGLLFVIHPVYPDRCAGVKHMKLYIRLTGLLMILIGVGLP